MPSKQNGARNRYERLSHQWPAVRAFAASFDNVSRMTAELILRAADRSNAIASIELVRKQAAPPGTPTADAGAILDHATTSTVGTTRRFDPPLLALRMSEPRLRCAGGPWWGRVHTRAGEGVADENSSDDEMHRVRDPDDRV